jgi:hypothetical protein
MRGTSRRLAAAGLLVAFAVTALVATNALRGPRQDGPLQNRSRFNASIGLVENQVLTWGIDLPGNPTDTDIKIRSIEPVGARGIEVLGVVLDYPRLRDGVCWSTGSHTDAFPPVGVSTREVKDAVLPAERTRTCGNHPEVLVGIRRPPGSASGRIDALRMVYEHQGSVYQFDIAYGLDIHPPDGDAK